MNKGETHKNEKHYHEVLFAEFRDQRVKGKPVKIRNIKNKISNGELPKLPISKYTGRMMCGGWHIKGICNTNCPEKDDHKRYTDEEYKDLHTWCVNHFPKEE